MAQRHPSVFIAPSELHGRGVFAAEPIEAGAIIEICPVLVLPPKDLTLIHKTALHDYYFLWGDAETDCGIVLGYGSIYNHSYEPNAEYTPDYVGDTLTIYAYKNIAAGDEITFNYNGNPESKTKIWFDRRE